MLIQRSFVGEEPSVSSLPKSTFRIRLLGGFNKSDPKTVLTSGFFHEPTGPTGWSGVYGLVGG